MNPQELGNLIGIDSKNIRKYARTHFHKGSNGWDFDEAQIQKIKDHFSGASTIGSLPAAPAIAPIITHDYRWQSAEGLTNFARSWLKDNYNIDLTIPIKVNNRIQRSLGRFRHERLSGAPVDIEIGKHTIEDHGKEVTLDVLKHELIHYACFTLKVPYRDGDWYFENELKKHGVARTHVYGRKGTFHVYICKCCGEQVAAWKRQKRSVGGYTSKCCRAGIEYAGFKEI